MNEGLKGYPSYKSAGTALPNSFPSHWGVNRAKVLLRQVDERSETGDEELLSVSHKTGVTPRREKSVSMFLAESNVGHKLCRPGDVVVNTMWAWMAAVGVSRHSGLVSPSYAVYRPRDLHQVHDRYFDALLRAPIYRDEFLVRSTGITSSRLRLYPDEFLSIALPLPPLDEQLAIGRFLDHADQRTRRYIQAKQATIAALAERRETVTQQAMDSAGIRTLRIRSAADKVERPIPRLDDEIYTPVGLYNRGRGIFHKAPTRGAELGDSRFFWLAEDDLVLSGQFAWEGAVSLATQTDAGCVASHRYAVIRGKPETLETAYLLSLFQTSWGRMILNHHSRGAAGRNRPLNVATLMKERVPIPPLAVQQQITRLVRLEDRLRHSVAELVLRLLEYRARLVADVVTGALDIREAAANLPDIADEVVGLDLDDVAEFDDAEAADLEEELE